MSLSWSFFSPIRTSRKTLLSLERIGCFSKLRVNLTGLSQARLKPAHQRTCWALVWTVDASEFTRAGIFTRTSFLFSVSSSTACRHQIKPWRSSSLPTCYSGWWNWAFLCCWMPLRGCRGLSVSVRGRKTTWPQHDRITTTIPGFVCCWFWSHSHLGYATIVPFFSFWEGDQRLDPYPLLFPFFLLSWKGRVFFSFLLLFGWSSDAWNIHSCCVLCETIPLSSGKNQESLLGLVWKAAAKENKNDSRNRKKAPQVTPNSGGFIQSIGNDSADWQIYVLMRSQEN